MNWLLEKRDDMTEKISEDIAKAAIELIQTANLKKNDILVVGCSTSEIMGHKIGSESVLEVAGAVFGGIYPVLEAKGIFLAAQCCEHLNRAIILEEEAARYYNYEFVNVRPQLKAGGAFATVCYDAFQSPVAVEEIKAAAGMDIGDTLIGMHLKKVAVPVRLQIKAIGQANLVCARTRPKFIGGERACYNTDIM